MTNDSIGDSKRGSLRSALCVSLTEMSCNRIEKCEVRNVSRSEIRNIYICNCIQHGASDSWEECVRDFLSR